MRSGRDTSGFVEFAGARSPALYRYAYLLVGERGLAEDLLQEALTKTYVAWGRVQRADNAEAYVRKVITNTAIGWWRRKAWQGERPRDDVPELEHLGHAEDVTSRAWLWDELQKLAPRQRAAIVLRYYEDLTEAQTAEILDCSVGTVKSQVSDGLKRLRERLGVDVLQLTGPRIGRVAIAE
ncbi:SigE family RNA polymerase sigma factor [Kribbella sp. NBC_01245]|uniref:SigE family RNA polymerase sigma factor n=1 Tax=Kribbella sp. NBC_01245 TaxID=2903578 RepID=UPI002E2CA169|nr:SigE family RNA polymerase sigma factor [Kribbella sp. NBC_01245]